MHGNHLAYGALATVTISVILTGGAIWEILNKLDLTYRKAGFYNDYIFWQLSSNLTNHAIFRDFGRVSFYPHDNIEEKASELFSNLEQYFLQKTLNAITAKMSVIDDILESPERYLYPLTTTIIACYLNNISKDDTEEFVNRILRNKPRKVKYIDASPERIAEVVNKISLLLLSNT